MKCMTKEENQCTTKLRPKKTLSKEKGENAKAFSLVREREHIV